MASEGGETLSGDSGGSVGVKRRFIGAKGSKPAVSTYPQSGFKMDSRSVRLGLADPATNVLLPLEVEGSVGKLELNCEGGIVVEPGSAPGWMGGGVFGRATPKVELLAEIHGQGVFETGQSNWIAQVGLRHDSNKLSTLLLAFGKPVTERSFEPQRFTIYLGIQLHC